MFISRIENSNEESKQSQQSTVTPTRSTTPNSQAEEIQQSNNELNYENNAMDQSDGMAIQYPVQPLVPGTMMQRPRMQVNISYTLI